MDDPKTNHSTPPSNCLVCAKTLTDYLEVLESTNNLIIEGKDAKEIFNLLCTSLTIKLNKKNSWDFEKEALPFCCSCTEISKDLVEIRDQILLLEKKFAGKVEQIKRLIIDSEFEEKEDQKDERFAYFRRQFAALRKEIRQKPSKRDSPKKNIPSTAAAAASVPPKFRLKNLNKLQEEPIEPETSTSSTGVRRSTRVTKKINKSDEQLSDSELENTDFQAECSDYSGVEDVVDEVDLKPFIEIKEEAQSDEQEYEIAGRLSPKATSPSPSSSTTTVESKKTNCKRKTRSTSKPVVEKVKKPRRKYASSDSNMSEGGASSDKDTKCTKKKATKRKKENIGIWDDEEEEESSDEDEDVEKDRVRKWRYDKKTKKLSYDGVEVISTENGLMCSYCDVEIKGDKKSNHKLRMKRHILIHLQKFQCIMCDKVMSCKKYLEMHVKMVHERSVIIPCKICEKPFTSVNAMKRHAWNHQNEEEKKAAIAAGKKQYGGGGRKSESVQCNQCGKMCKGLYNLKRHEETHIDQSERLKHMCSICGVLYSAPETLRSHIKLTHENNNRLQWLQCPHPGCQKKYPQPGRLDKHMRTHTGEKPYKCPECGTGFSQSTLLKVHMLKHKNVRPFNCEHCDMSFFRRYHLQRHEQIYHQSDNPPTKKQPYRSENGTRKPPQRRTRKKITQHHIQDHSGDSNTDPHQDPLQLLGILATEPPTTARQQPKRSRKQIISFDSNNLNPDQGQNQSGSGDTNTVDDPHEQLLGTIVDEPLPPPPTFTFTNSSGCAYPFSFGLNQ